MTARPGRLCLSSIEAPLWRPPSKERNKTMYREITTRCVISGPQGEIDRFKQFAFTQKDDGTEFDFNRFIPMPALIEETVAGTTPRQASLLICAAEGRSPPSGWGELDEETIRHLRQALSMPDVPLTELAKAWLSEYPDWADLGEKRLRAIAEFGFADSQAWADHHWGTRWNSSSVNIPDEQAPGSFKFSFATADGFPTPVFEKIANDFPQLNIRCTCACDDSDQSFGDGYFNPKDGQAKFALCDPADENRMGEIYRRVFGDQTDAIITSHLGLCYGLP
jgi:hypothetical protein